MADGEKPDYKVRILEAILFARKALLSPTVQMAHIKALAKGTAKYPLRPVDCKVYSIPQGGMSHTRTRTSSSGRYRNDSYCGVSTMSHTTGIMVKPIQRQEQRQNFLAVYVDGRQVPAKPLQPNFENGATFEATST